MVNVVFLFRGCVDAWPESELPEKFPSLLVTEHVRAPFAFQKTLVRFPLDTVGGTAHISALIEPRYAGGAGGGGGGATGDAGAALAGFAAVLAVLPVMRAPSANPRAVQRLSKYAEGIM